MSDQVLQLKIEQHQIYLKSNGKEGAVANLSHADLSELSLSGVNLSSADLSYANFSRCANLEGLNLSGAKMTGAIFENANFSFLDLTNSDLSYIKAIGANFSGADLSNANLRGADLSNANLRGARMRNADLRYANLNQAALDDADVGFCVPNMAEIKGAYFGSPDLPIVWLWEQEEIIVWFGCHRKPLESWKKLSNDNRLVRSHDPFGSWGGASSKLFEIIELIELKGDRNQQP